MGQDRLSSEPYTYDSRGLKMRQPSRPQQVPTPEEIYFKNLSLLLHFDR